MKFVRFTMMDDGKPVYVYPHQVCLVRNARGDGGGTLIVTVSASVTVREALASVVQVLTGITLSPPSPPRPAAQR